MHKEGWTDNNMEGVASLLHSHFWMWKQRIGCWHSNHSSLIWANHSYRSIFWNCIASHFLMMTQPKIPHVKLSFNLLRITKSRWQCLTQPFFQHCQLSKSKKNSYQKPMIQKFENPYIFVNLPTGFGKSLILIKIFLWQHFQGRSNTTLCTRWTNENF